MDKEKLESYKKLCITIRRQERRLDYLSRRDKIESDVVSGSINQFPYTASRFKITGTNTRDINQLAGEIEKNTEKAEVLKSEINRCIDGVTDELTRDILRCRYIDCMRSREAARVNNVSESHMRRKIRDFLKS